MLRDGSSAGDAQARIDAQLPLAQKEALAQVVLHNDGDRQALQEQVCRQRVACWAGSRAAAVLAHKLVQH
jgi:dephospho-CoA kinase